MTITIKLKTDNAAFRDDNGDNESACLDEIARIVTDWLNHRIEPLRQVGPQPLYDYNGNAVGSVTVRGK